MVIASMCGSSAFGAYGSGGSVNGIVDFSSFYSELSWALSCILSSAFCVLLNRIREAKHRPLVEMPGQNLHSHRQTVRCGSARDAHAWNPRERAGDGVNVGKVHRHRVIDLLAQLERRERRNRRHDGVHLFESPGEIARHQSAHLL